MKKQQGFTLIELIMVIVILGILSAFALPRFANLSGQAEAATLEGGVGAVRSSAAIVHAFCLASGTTCDTSPITMDGVSIAVDTTNHYPTATAAGIGAAAALDGFTVGAAGAITLDDNTACDMTYDASNGTVVNNGC